LRLGDRSHERLLVVRQRRVAVRCEHLGEDLDLARRRGKSPGRATLRFGESAIACLEGHPYSLRVLAQSFERHPGSLKLVTIRGIDVAVPEVVAETEPAGQIEHNL